MLFTASNVHKSSHGCIHILSAPAWGAQRQPGELVAGLPVLEHHRCHPPSMQPTHHAKAHPLRQLSNRFTLRGEHEANCLTERSLKHLLNSSSLRLITGNPPGRFFRRHERSSTRQHKVLVAQPSAVTILTGLHLSHSHSFHPRGNAQENPPAGPNQPPHPWPG